MTAVVFFAFQVYCDFNAYSLIAIGSAKLMGYRLMQNFNHPYLSRSFAEYWNRWHISLSSWFEDYIFTPFIWSNPLQRFGTYFTAPPMRIGLILVFLVSGFWHGANWTFVLWGLCHAMFRIFEASTTKKRKKFYKKHHIAKDAPALVLLEICVTFTLNNISYILFRANTISQAFAYLKCIVCGAAGTVVSIDSFGMARGELILSAGLIFLLVIWEIVNERRHKNQSIDVILEEKPVPVQAFVYAFLLLLLVVCGVYGANYVQNPFIYFQF